MALGLGLQAPGLLRANGQGPQAAFPTGSGPDLALQVPVTARARSLPSERAWAGPRWLSPALRGQRQEEEGPRQLCLLLVLRAVSPAVVLLTLAQD